MADKTYDWDSDFESENPNEDTGKVRYGGRYDNDTRKAITERLDDEHIWDLNEAAPQNQMGMHKEGSGISYYGAIEPFYRPDGVTELNSDDAGRLWYDTDNVQIKGWNGSFWVNLSAPAAGSKLRWEDDVQYDQEEIVEYQGELWIALADPPTINVIPDEPEWQLFEVGMPDDIVWTEHLTYVVDQLVYYSGVFWIAVTPVKGDQPGLNPGEWVELQMGTESIADSAITTDKLADASVTNVKLNSDAHEIMHWRSDYEYTQDDIVQYQSMWWVCYAATSIIGDPPSLVSAAWRLWSDQTTEAIDNTATIEDGYRDHSVFADTSINPVYTVTLEDGQVAGDKVTISAFGGGQIDVDGTGLTDQTQLDVAIEYLWEGTAWIPLGGGSGGGGGSGLEVGEVIWFATRTQSAPEGALKCDGTTYLIADYPSLFAVISNRYGGDGITDFNVPTMDDLVYGDQTSELIESDPDGIFVIQAEQAAPSEINAVVVDGTIGQVRWWGADTVDQYDLECNGASYDTTDYSDLFGVIGYNFGGSGANFNVPDLQGIFPGAIGVQGSHGDVGWNIGDLIEDSLEAHTHVQDAHTHIQDAHTHTQNSHNHTQPSHIHTMPTHSHLGGSREFDSTNIRNTMAYGFTAGSGQLYQNQPNTQTGNYVQAQTQSVDPGDTFSASTTINNAVAVNQVATATNQSATATNQSTGGTETRPASLMGKWVIRAKNPDLYEIPVVEEGSITTDYLADDAVTNPKVADNAIDTAEIVDGAVTTAKIADLNVTTAKIADLNVINSKIGEGAVWTINLADNSVKTAKISDLNVSTPKIANLNVTEGKLATNAVTTSKIADANVTLAKLASEVLNAIYPVGYVYIVFSGSPNPTSMGLPGTWANVSSTYAGRFFRAEGGDAAAYGGTQLDQMQRITGSAGQFNTQPNVVTSAGAMSVVFNAGDTADDPGGYARRTIDFDSADSPNARTSSTTSGETRPTNSTIQVWKRTS